MATNIKLKSSSVLGKTPTLSDLSLRELAVNTVDGKLFLRKGDGSGTDKIIDVTAPLQASEPMGHENKSQSTISFNTVNRRFTIQPASTSFNVWCKGVKYNFTTAQTVDLPNTTGIYYIYFDGDGALQYRTSYFDWENDAPTAYVYWNATTGTAPFVADERHGIVLDWQTHEYLHRTRGAAIANGFSISNYTTTGTGANNSDAQFDLGGGTFFDEDLEVIITHSNTPTSDTWQQDLEGPSQIPVFYQSGNGWVRDAVTDYALKQGTARIQYNYFNGASWSALDVPTDTWYTTSWIIATNNINYPVIAIMGQSATNKISDQEALTFGDLILDGFPVVEFRPLWKIIWQTDSGYANTPNARIAGVYDIRQSITFAATGGGGTPLSVTDDISTNATRYILFDDATSGDISVINVSSTKLTYNPSTGILSATGFSGSGSGLTSLNASNLSSGTVGTERLGSGTADSTTFLRGDGSWSSIPSTSWGSISGTLSTQTDLQNALDAKQATLVSGTNIKTVNGTTILGSGDIDLSTSLTLDGTDLKYINIDGTLQTISLSAFLDDTTNTVVSAALSGNTITFTREDSTTFTLDVTNLYDDTNLVTSVNGSTGAVTVQETLVSGTNIKTVNGNSILGSGDLTVSTSAAWGSISGTLSTQTDLQNALDAKQATLVSGTNIKTINGNSILGSGDLAISGGGASVTVSDTAPSTPSSGDLWWKSNEGRLKIYYADVDSSQWVDTFLAAKGEAGTLQVGTVTTSSPGSSASVTNVGTSSSAILDFVLPRGESGPAGPAATISVGTVTTGSPGSSAAVINSGTSSNAVLDFTIPAGAVGAITADEAIAFSIALG